MPRKVCTKCNEEKDISEYHKHSQNGYRPRCKTCRALEKSLGKRFGPNSYLFGITEKKSRKQIVQDVHGGLGKISGNIFQNWKMLFSNNCGETSHDLMFSAWVLIASH